MIPGAMTSANDILEYLHRNSPWLDPAHTVDTVKWGDGGRAVRRAGVCWYASANTIEAAHAAGCDLLVCHEPIFWDGGRVESRWKDTPARLAKERLLERTGLTVLRAHDSWDQWPEIGIRESWARFLGLTDRVYASEETESHAFQAMYRIDPQPLRVFAQRIADRIGPLGEDSVQVMGDPERLISRPSLGVGCIGPDAEVVARGSDCVIGCYDGAWYWMTRERLWEQGAAIVTVEHGTCEMPGIESLSAHLAGVFPEVEFRYFAEHPRTWTVRGGAACPALE